MGARVVCQESHRPAVALTREQETRLYMARQDLDTARAVDLAALDLPTLILLFERLRGSLDDVLRLINDLNGPAQR